MSNVYYVFLNKKMVPEKNQLQNVIHKLGFDYKLDPDFSPFQDEGYSPGSFNDNTQAGFEIYYLEAADVTEGDTALEQIADGRDYCINLCWTGEVHDLTAVSIVSAAYIDCCDAVVTYDGESKETIETLIETANKSLQEMTRTNEANLGLVEYIKEVEEKGTQLKILQEHLNNLIGTSVSAIDTWSGISMQFSNNNILSAPAVRCVLESGQIIDVSNYLNARAEQMKFIRTIKDWPTEQENAQLLRLSQIANTANELDGVNVEKLKATLESWPDIITVKNAVFVESSNVIQLEFEEMPGNRIDAIAVEEAVRQMELWGNDIVFKISDTSISLSEKSWE